MGISIRSDKGPRSAINLTPLVDVVLVLLVIFLIAMPVLVRHIPIEVPRELPPGEVSSVTSPIVLVGNADGTVEVDDGTGLKRHVSRIDLARTIRPMVDALRTDRVVFVDFDDALRYEEVVSILDTVKGMGRDAAGHESSPIKIAVRTTGRRAPPARIDE